MNETGRILTVEGNHVTVKLAALNCFGCMNRECKKNDGIISAINPAGLLLEKGQLVKVEIKTPTLAAQGLKAALPPVIGFAAAYIFTRFFTSMGEGLRILLGLIIMAVFGALFYMFRSRFPAKIAASVTGIEEIGEAC